MWLHDVTSCCSRKKGNRFDQMGLPTNGPPSGGAHIRRSFVHDDDGGPKERGITLATLYSRFEHLTIQSPTLPRDIYLKNACQVLDFNGARART